MTVTQPNVPLFQVQLVWGSLILPCSGLSGGLPIKTSLCIGRFWVKKRDGEECGKCLTLRKLIWQCMRLMKFLVEIFKGEKERERERIKKKTKGSSNTIHLFIFTS